MTKTKKEGQVEWLKYPSGFFRVWISRKEQKRMVRKEELNKLLERFREPLV